MKKTLLTLALIPVIFSAQTFTKADTLKGSNTVYRNFWDVQKYEIEVEPQFETKTLRGNNTISFKILKDVQKPVFQIDLQQPMNFSLAQADQKKYTPRRDGDFIFLQSNTDYRAGETASFTIYFEGKPTEAKNAPWDGGWVWKKDTEGNPWMSVAQEGIGASVWLPLKDLWSDEPDQGMVMSIITAPELTGVGNGRLIRQEKINGKNKFTWQVTNPINAYSIVPNVGKYVHFGEQFSGEKGTLDLDYWVLEENLGKAKKQFTQVKPILAAFEYWFGPYPFYEDSYKLIETPYLGMEHQSGVGYGNGYANGYLGRDLSGTGVGLNWDFIIVHESGHEWFANNITAQDKADMWIHESFTNYSETLFTERYMNKQAGSTYVQGIRQNIKNDKTIIGPYGVAKSGSGDMYYKGANMLHTIRQVINNDEKFRQILRGLNKTFYHQTVTSKQVEDYISRAAGFDFSTVFDQYLRTVQIPVLEYKQKGRKLQYRYQNTVPNLHLPVRPANADITLHPTENWQRVKLTSKAPVQFSAEYYINYREK